MKYQSGLATVEFALIGALAFTVLFGVIEIGRALFVWNTLSEATRRGARLAAVCPMGDPAIARVAILSNPGGPNTSPVVSNLSTANVTVAYLQADGVTLAASVTETKYVRVAIVGFQHTLLIPFVMPTITAPPFSTTLPAESLGYLPDTNTYGCPFGT
jgi:Flp pilus assembly protein TadG